MTSIEISSPVSNLGRGEFAHTGRNAYVQHRSAECLQIDILFSSCKLNTEWWSRGVHFEKGAQPFVYPIRHERGTIIKSCAFCYPRTHALVPTAVVGCPCCLHWPLLHTWKSKLSYFFVTHTLHISAAIPLDGEEEVAVDANKMVGSNLSW